jgi:predicted O-linked N-acetylglucosamine transferase (SPINDLY family)
MTEAPSAPARALGVSQALHEAAAAYGSGDWARAQVLCEHALATQADSSEALNLLGVIAARTGDAERALECYERALAIRPDSPEMHFNRGNALRDLKRLEAALECYGEALKLRPLYAEALNNRGNALRDLGRSEQALDSYAQALRIRPDLVLAHCNTGNLLVRLGHVAQALTSYDAALAVAPANAVAHNGRGGALRRLGRVDEAIESHQRACEIQPDFVEAHVHLAIALEESGRHARALDVYEHVLTVCPQQLEALVNRGGVLMRLSRVEEALQSYENAIAARPDVAALHYNCGNVLRELGRFPHALECYGRALALQPDYADALVNSADILRQQDRLPEALEHFERAFRLKPELDWLEGICFITALQVCAWDGFSERAAHLSRRVALGDKASAPFVLLAFSDDAALQRRAAECWIREACPERTLLSPIEHREREPRIRVGYYSADFHAHATAHLMAGLIEQHDRSQFEIIAFSFGPPFADHMRARLSRAFDKFIDVSDRSDREIAELSRTLKIDIAVDLKGLTDRQRTGIFAHRAAPIQVSYLGYPGTMGAPYIDYLIADTVLIPDAARQHYTENVVWLPDSYQVNDRRRPYAGAASARQPLNLPERAFVFCSFNSSYKLTPEVFDIWIRLLQNVAGSVLWLLDDNPTATVNLKREARLRGVTPERLIFAPRLPVPPHLARLPAADLFLDTWPCTAHTTASDALWTGLPVLTRCGESFASRVAASLLMGVGLPQLITHSAAEYEARALELSTHLTELRQIRQQLTRNRLSCPLFDTARTTARLESAFRACYEAYHARRPARDLRIDP